MEGLGDNKPVSHKTLQSKVMMYYDSKEKAIAAFKVLKVQRPKTVLLREEKDSGKRAPVPVS